MADGAGKKMKQRTLAICCFMTVFLGWILYNLVYRSLITGEELKARAADQQLREAVLPAARGEIFSSDGTLLAASETCWTIRAAPRELADELVEPAARALSEILDIDYAETLEKLNRAEKIEYTGQHVGILNVKHRFALLYQGKSIFSFSNLKKGSRIELFIPEEGGNDDRSCSR